MELNWKRLKILNNRKFEIYQLEIENINVFL